MIRESLEEIDGCQIDSISSKTGKLVLECSKDISDAQIRSTIHEAGYSLSDEKTHNTSHIKMSRMQAIPWIIFAGILLFFLFRIDISGLMPSYEKLGFGVAFLVGLVASVSTCLAVTGGIVIGYTESVSDKNHGLMTQLRFHMGRIITFILGGFVLGMVGKTFSGSVYFNGFLSIFVGMVLAYLGAQLLGLVPNISRWGFHLPTGFSRGITKLKNPKYAPWVGVLTFLLPCGFTQSMMLFAIGSGNPWQGALVMGAFALGTFPVLFAIGLGTEYVKEKLKILNPLIASFLLVFGIFTATNGWNILEATRSSFSREQTVEAQDARISRENPPMSILETETIAWSHDGYNFSPSTLTLATGKNYRITITPTSDGLGCKYSVILPDGREQFIKKGEPFDITVNGSTPGRIKLVCGSMGMRQGEIVIE